MQVWLTSDEVARHFRCTAGAVLGAAFQHGWDVQIGSDGVARLRLPPAAAMDFVLTREREASEGTREGQARVDQLEAELRLERERNAELMAANLRLLAERGKTETDLPQRRTA